MDVIIDPPAFLRSLNRWIVWKYETLPGSKLAKVPYNPQRHFRADVTNLKKNGKSFEVAYAALQKGGYAGLGIILGSPLVGIDLDGFCRDEVTGAIDPWAMEVMTNLNSYSEASPSGTGIHIIARSVLPRGGKRREHIEVYAEGRFLTFTGQHIPGTPSSIEQRIPEVYRLCQSEFPEIAKSHDHAKPARVARQDEEVVRRLEARSPRFARLMYGDRTGYRSDSEADIALCSYLATETIEPAQIDRIMRASGLMRAKWDRVDYRERTITKVLHCPPYRRENVDIRLISEDILTRYGVQPRALSPEWMTYLTRLRAERLEIQLPKVELAPLPQEASTAVRKTYEGFRLCLQCYWLRFPRQPVQYTRRFAQKWAKVGYVQANDSIMWLRNRGFLKVVGYAPGKVLSAPLYLPGCGVPDDPTHSGFQLIAPVA